MSWVWQVPGANWPDVGWSHQSRTCPSQSSSSGHKICRWLGGGGERDLLYRLTLEVIFGAGCINYCTHKVIHIIYLIHPGTGLFDLFCKYWLGTCCVPGTLRGTRDIMVKIGPFLITSIQQRETGLLIKQLGVYAVSACMVFSQIFWAHKFPLWVINTNGQPNESNQSDLSIREGGREFLPDSGSGSGCWTGGQDALLICQQKGPLLTEQTSLSLQ